MITDLFLNLFAWILSAFANHLPTWQIWPHEVLTGLNYFFSTLKGLNFIIPVDTFFSTCLLLISFISAMIPVWITLKILKRNQ